MVTHSSILAWRIPSGQRSLRAIVHEVERVRQDWTTNHSTAHNILKLTNICILKDNLENYTLSRETSLSFWTVFATRYLLAIFHWFMFKRHLVLYFFICCVPSTFGSSKLSWNDLESTHIRLWWALTWQTMKCCLFFFLLQSWSKAVHNL